MREDPEEVDLIEVRRTGEGDPLELEVVVRDGKGETRHHVMMARETSNKLTAGKHTPERVLRRPSGSCSTGSPRNRSFGRFDVMVISRCFPEFEQELPGYLSRS